MLKTDSNWWVEALLAVGFLVGSIVFPVLYLSSFLPLDQTYGEPITSDVLIAMAFALGFLLLTVVFAVMSVRSLHRQRVRMRAIRSHADAMPAARIAFHPEKAPDVTAQPLVLQ